MITRAWRDLGLRKRRRWPVSSVGAPRPTRAGVCIATGVVSAGSLMRSRPLYAAAKPTATIEESRRASRGAEDEPAVQRREPPEHEQGDRPVPHARCLLDEQGPGPEDHPGARTPEDRRRPGQPPPQTELCEQAQEDPDRDEGDAESGVHGGIIPAAAKPIPPRPARGPARARRRARRPRRASS